MRNFCKFIYIYIYTNLLKTVLDVAITEQMYKTEKVVHQTGFGGAPSVMLIVIGNGRNDMSSNPGRGRLNLI